ncbi:MAG TPA: hypothetical protein DIC53_09595 [Synergistaceae bacterium]|jgi:predicted transcriptional regulator YheO|nr:hypothetical protein [Synergistaceae bacterium]
MKKERPVHPLLLPYFPIVKGLAKILGPNCEVLLHDVSTPESSVIACENADISGRSVGAPMTAFGRQLLSSKEYADRDGIYNYYSRTDDGKLLKCSAIFIRDNERKFVGMICVNMDVTHMVQAKGFLEAFLGADEHSGASLGAEVPQSPPCAADTGNGVPIQTEIFYKELGDVWEHLLHELKGSLPTSLDRLTSEETRTVVGKLEEQGFFMMKGAVNVLAREIGKSPCTIYNHLRQHRKQKASEQR